MFTNREIATGIWIGFFLVYALTQKNLLQPILSMVGTFFGSKLLPSFLAAALYTIVIVMALKFLGIWKFDEIKDTVLWFLFSGIGLAFSQVTSYDKDFLKKTVVDNLRVLVIVEFVTSSYTFSLIGELILFPALFFLAAIIAVAGMDEKHSTVKRIFEWLQSFVGFAMLYVAVRGALNDYNNLISFDTFRSFLLTPLLSISFLPFVYLYLVYINYDSLTVRINCGVDKNSALRRYAVFKLIKHLGINLPKGREFLQTKSFRLMHIESRQDVDNLLQNVSSEYDEDRLEEFENDTLPNDTVSNVEIRPITVGQTTEQMVSIRNS